MLSGASTNPALQEAQGGVAPPALGPAPDAATDPFAIAMWGITTETANNWLEAKEVEPGEITEPKGFPAASGGRERPARVGKDLDELSGLKVGEFLAGSTTSPVWAVLFTVFMDA